MVDMIHSLTTSYQFGVQSLPSQSETHRAGLHENSESVLRATLIDQIIEKKSYLRCAFNYRECHRRAQLRGQT